ncbi:MAG: MBL fold metallo-hydrolase [Planctomycetota bacterium]|nr:MBL fold metallo-hydrolase [Planctomycetota bacterium]
MQEHGEYLSFFVAVCDEAEYPYRPDHGLAILISTTPGPPNFFSDTGSNPRPLQKNLLIHGASLDTVAAIAISHGHYDHTGGLSAFRTVGRAPRLSTPTPESAANATWSSAKARDISAFPKNFAH